MLDRLRLCTNGFGRVGPVVDAAVALSQAAVERLAVQPSASRRDRCRPNLLDELTSLLDVARTVDAHAVVELLPLGRADDVRLVRYAVVAEPDADGAVVVSDQFAVGQAR